MISIRHLSKQFEDVTPLRDINLEIERGEVVSIIGPSGTGKSTLLRCINLLERPTGGEIWVDGQNILDKATNVEQLHQKMGMVFQSFNLFNHLTILENLCIGPMKLEGLTRETAEEQAHELLRKVGLSNKADAMPSQLSGGQKQRAAIARCLSMQPDVILFDEPTSALDPTMVNEVLGVITQLAKQGMTMIIVTHEMKFAYSVSTRVVLLAEGEVYEQGTPEQVFDHPQRPITQDFVYRMQTLSFEVDGNDFDFYDLGSQLQQFCFKFNVSENRYLRTLEVAQLVVDLARPKDGRLLPMRLKFDFSEKNGNLYMELDVTGRKESILDGVESPEADRVRTLCIKSSDFDDHGVRRLRLKPVQES